MTNYSLIRKKARALYRKYKTRDPFRLAEELGITIIYSNQLKRLKGMYRVVKKNRYIILNSQNTEQMNRIVLAHEIAHDQLHREYADGRSLREFTLYDMSVPLEYEANLFVAELLLDNDEILNYIRDGMDTVSIAKATETDINLVALKVDFLIREGYPLNRQNHNSKFLK